MPTANEYDHADAYPEHLVEKLKELGLFGITVPDRASAVWDSTWLHLRHASSRSWPTAG
ncbi:MAG: acyl-CoA dehydrogenase family protein [Acidimicrobiia bacterium]|nr:acyl-CoA dehydrogenase family protein [Acidimicrobiia bacterium]